MDTQNLTDTASKLVADDKGLLAMDESNPTCNKRFAKLKDESLEESANLPAPEVIAQEITDDLETALEQFSTITEDLKK